jgi:hypothetical protein
MKSFKQILQEMTAHREAAEIEKALKRIEDFETRSKGNDSKWKAQINLRTKKMNNVDKLKIWVLALTDAGLKDESKNAEKRLKQLGEEIAIIEAKKPKALKLEKLIKKLSKGDQGKRTLGPSDAQTILKFIWIQDPQNMKDMGNWEDVSWLDKKVQQDILDAYLDSVMK